LLPIGPVVQQQQSAKVARKLDASGRNQVLMAEAAQVNANACKISIEWDSVNHTRYSLLEQFPECHA
jgi:hypothetical protein